MESYQLEKWIWTEKDFDKMGWHDAAIYGVRLDQNLELDIDYIFQWNYSDVEGFYFTFWVAPATLVFEKPTDLSFELTQSFDDRWLEIENVEGDMKENQRSWTIFTQQGEISFKADSYKQVIKKRPSLQLQQTVPYDERGGYNFSTVTGEREDEKLPFYILERRKKEFGDYELAKRRFVINKELEALYKMREKGQIQTKDFLIKKKNLKENINSLTFQLRGSRYEVV